MPVWPICFCNCWPMPAAAPMRLPAAITPMSFIATPPSASALSAASAAKSTVSRLGCLPNFVMWIPRIHTSSRAIGLLQRLETEADRLGAVVVRTDHIGSQADLHAKLHVLRIGCGVDDVGAHARPTAVDDRRDERDRDARRGHRHDRERPQHALGVDRRL